MRPTPHEPHLHEPVQELPEQQEQEPQGPMLEGIWVIECDAMVD